MSSRDRMTVAAAVAVGLCASALSPMFAGKQWGSEVYGAIAVVAATGVVGRRLSLPRLIQPVLALLVLAGYLLVVFAGGTLSHGLPTGASLDRLRALADAANSDIQRYRAPVPPNEGLILLSAAGVGVVAVLVDLLAVTLRRAALAGLPLLALFAVPSAVVPGGVGSVPFALGAVGWLLVLGVEGQDVVSRWGSTPQGAPVGQSSLGRMGRRIGVSALSVAVVVPLLVPGLGKTLIGGGGPAGEGDGPSSSAHTYNPITTLRSQLTQPKAVQLFQYRTDDPAPDYIRMTTLDRYDGQGWSASPLSQRRDEAQVQKGIKAAVDDAGPHQSLTMKLQIDSSHLDVFWLPLPFGPRKVDVKGTWLWDPASQTAFSASRTTRDLPAYTVQAERPTPDRATLALARITDVDVGVRQQYGGPVNVTTAVSDLTHQIVDSAATPYAKAVALQAWFTGDNRFRYDLKPTLAAPGEDPLEHFLLRTRAGFCEQYATAMAAMLRLVGIPSRVAVGFTRGDPIDTSKDGTSRTFSVTTHNAHAWPEAWFAGTGWIRFEPTPAQSGATVPGYTTPGAVVPRTGPAAGTPTPTPSASSTAKSSLPREDLLDRRGGTAATGSQSGSHRLLWVLGLLLVLLVAAAPAVLTLVRRRRRWRRPDPLIAWDQLRQDADDIGHRWRASESPRAAAARLRAQRRLPQPASDALERLAVAAERARFAAAAPPGGSLVEDVATIRAALRQTCTRWVRWRARAYPPSTLRWAASSAGDLVEGTSERIDNQVNRVKQRVRR
ncbi:MAG: transglutaminase domain protein [Frankiales bacterium]|nr:transglutaminase domain protein [Frankiales bacterium]